MPNETVDPNGSLLTISAEIISQEPEGFIIRVKNDESGETFEAQSVREYAEFLIESVNRSARDNFVATWLPSPRARKRDIDLIGMQLGMMDRWMQEELRQAEAPEDDGGLMDALDEQSEKEEENGNADKAD
ncbi:hypothetical protein [Nitratifractor sp.]|uniref:hypothetical protein n=1 Tax=Nitratifractor sp. TaxID=2268144 RepID=UPI0025EC9F27|nr:hypothetical protein [Nitratifractor sp.]